MASIQRIDDERAASALADLLNGNARRHPVVVVTISAGRTTPWIDVEEITREAGDLADVYLMPTGHLTWEFSNRMAEGTQVYGGAGRVYPVGHEWATDLSKSPLRFAFNADDGQRASQHLISDMFRMAAAAGLLQMQPASRLHQADGVVKMTVAGRALVDIGGRFPAAIAEELTVENVQIDRIVKAGQRIEGMYDPETNRLDIRNQLQRAADALVGYRVGDVVLTKVTKVRSGRAELMLYPKTSTPATLVTVLRADVTSNPADDLQTLMTPGEVIPARLTSTSPAWALVLNDVDDDEPVTNVPSLLVGGPVWLVEDEDEDASPVEPAQSLTPPSPPPPASLTEPLPELPPEAAPLTAPRPSPAMLDRNRTPGVPAPTGPANHAPPAAATRTLLLKIDGLAAEVGRLTRDSEQFRGQLLAATDEREQLRYLLSQAERSANRAENDLRAARARLRKAGNLRSGPVSSEGPKFANREQGFRYLVLTQWATRTLPGEQRDRPLVDYVIGPRFLDSLDKLEGIKAEKVADVAFEIVTGLAPQLLSREVHRLRTGLGGDDPIHTREDGATAWRASLQVNSPSARRIHYWVPPNGPIELARVATHDDFDA